ncbi:MAG: hypothetical protein VKJ02_01095 [Snowella sp.]|nr:hypothetical protein [Snowella sp.]
MINTNKPILSVTEFVPFQSFAYQNPVIDTVFARGVRYDTMAP